MTPQDLLTARAVRDAAGRMKTQAEAGGLAHWTYAPDRLPAIADRIAAVTRAARPDLTVPFHARWRHFEVGGRDRWGESDAGAGDTRARARAAFDLAIVSVLLDAGSGGLWHWREPETGTRWRSSEGLGLASFAMLAAGTLSARGGDPWRADASRLRAFGEADLAATFQVSGGNPLAGVAGRVHLINRLGAEAERRADLFALADDPRPGGLADVVAALATGGSIPAPAILELVLEALGPIWPSRLVLDGVPLGDSWVYGPWQGGKGVRPEAVVPFHKLSQWMTYSLIEPTQAMGIRVTDIGGLTGLAEYRNGGLLVDEGALVLSDRDDADREHAVGSDLVVEWRAMTVALLDALHPMVVERLGTDAARFPLACMLEGGSWAAGRIVAAARRPGGGPPIRVESDGTAF